jgi:hypothetical protein
MVMLAACGYDPSNGVAYPADDVGTIALSVASTDPMTSAGDTRVVTAIVRSTSGSVIAAPTVSWSTSTPSVATVAGSGSSATVTAVDDGTAIITAASGTVASTVTVTVRRRVVSIALSGPDAVVVPGFTTQLTVVGLDARQQSIRDLTGVTFTTSNGFSVIVSPTGLATALYSSFQPVGAIVTATITRDGVTLSATKRIDVGNPAPPAFGFSGLMSPEQVQPEPTNLAADGIVFFTLNGTRIQFKMLWSLLSGPPTSAHIHGPDDGTLPAADVLVDMPLGSQLDRNGTLTGSFSAADIHPQGGRAAISLDSLVTLLGTPGAVYVDVHTALSSDGELRGLVFPRR